MYKGRDGCILEGKIHPMVEFREIISKYTIKYVSIYKYIFVSTNLLTIVH